MRTLGFRTHVLLAIAAAVGLAAVLSRPWYAAAPQATTAADPAIGDINGPLSSFFVGLERWVTETTGMTGAESLGYFGIAILAMAGIAALGALGALSQRAQAVGREALRYGSLAALAIVAWKLLDPPGSNAVIELRYGAFVALGCALILVSCGAEVCNSPLLRSKRKRSTFTAPPPPPAYESARSSAPPGT